MSEPRTSTTERDPWYPGGQRDASVWVEEYFRIYPDGCGDADTMLGWFANAIETGVMFGAREARAPLDVERLAKALAKACPWHLANEHVPCAPNVAREYAALEEPPPGPQYTEDDPDWSAMVSPISEKDGGHDDR